MKATMVDVYKRIWIVSGTVMEANTGMPGKGMPVVAFDVDHMCKEPLGKGVTDSEGRYCIIFTWDNYKHLLPFQPDVYIKVYDEANNLLKDTRNEVVRTVSCRKTIDTQVEVCHEEEASCLTIDDLIGSESAYSLAYAGK